LPSQTQPGQASYRYFDAVGPAIPRNDAASPISNRETLKQYDPDLFSLVDETMGHWGKVDWQYQP